MRLSDPKGLEIRNDLAELRRVSSWLGQFCGELSLPPSVAFDLEVCAHEVITNVVDYAYRDTQEHRITLLLSFADNDLKLQIEDDGEPFNPLDVPSTEGAASLEDARIGGLGIALIRSLVSECSYLRRDGKNVLTLRIQTPPMAEEAP